MVSPCPWKARAERKSSARTTTTESWTFLTSRVSLDTTSLTCECGLLFHHLYGTSTRYHFSEFQIIIIHFLRRKFADHHVEGSPFTAKVTGEGSNRQREKIQRKREAVPITEVGSKCRLTFKMPGITSFDLSATVTSPGGVTEDAEIKEIEDGLYAVAFVPKELGVHTVSTKYRDMHIPGR